MTNDVEAKLINFESRKHQMSVHTTEKDLADDEQQEKYINLVEQSIY